jgi:hypothetical protein
MTETDRLKYLRVACVPDHCFSRAARTPKSHLVRRVAQCCARCDYGGAVLRGPASDWTPVAGCTGAVRRSGGAGALDAWNELATRRLTATGAVGARGHTRRGQLRALGC